MKVQVIYSSISGNTKRLAEGIYDGILNCEKEIIDLNEGVPALDGDIILLGYWVEQKGPNEAMKNFMKSIENKVVGVFCTLGFYADSKYGVDSAFEGVNILKEKNTVIGNYVCNGHLSDKMIEMFRRMPMDKIHSASVKNEIRWDVMKQHPTPSEIALAAERFNERVELYRRYSEAGIEFSVL